LAEKELFTESTKPNHQFFVSDYTKSFEESTKIFFGETLQLEYYPLWD
jgi:glutamate racemase